MKVIFICITVIDGILNGKLGVTQGSILRPLGLYEFKKINHLICKASGVMSSLRVTEKNVPTPLNGSLLGKIMRDG